MSHYEEKKETLRRQIRQYASEDLAVAFSGGVDSSLLLKIAGDAVRETGRKVYGIFLRTMLHPAREAREAEQAAGETGAVFRVLELDELEEAGIGDNPVDRCYRCKRYLFRAVREEAEGLGAARILEGTNEDDLHVYRPGVRAVRELGILSPLADAGMTKEEVRRMAEEYGISAARKPSAPCLATRFPYGTPISYEMMRKAEAGEEFLKTLGLYNVRLRVHGKVARIEVDREDMGRVLEQRDAVAAQLKSLGYTYITLDIEGFRSGSMDIEIPQNKKSAAGGI